MLLFGNNIDKQAELRTEESEFWKDELTIIEKAPHRVPEKIPEKAKHSKRPNENSAISTCAIKVKCRCVYKLIYLLKSFSMIVWLLCFYACFLTCTVYLLFLLTYKFNCGYCYSNVCEKETYGKDTIDLEEPKIVNTNLDVGNQPSSCVQCATLKRGI
jgi:hypothetical protein